jgi:hypothetical protein
LSKKVLIISPHFPPLNAADMQRVRMSLPYFKDFGWEATVVAVDPKYADIAKDELLVKSLPANIEVHYVKAFSKKITAKFGLGSLALRSLWYYRKTVDNILKKGKYDLVYFSTTEFTVCTLGPHWKKKFGTPYVIDMQDPWYSDYYDDKPKEQRPPKYWLSYGMHKKLEPIALKYCNGLVSVSPAYIHDLKARYPQIKDIPAATITFGSFAKDLEIAEANRDKFASVLDNAFKNIVYIGRGGADMAQAVTPVLAALKDLQSKEPSTFKKIKFYFIGTSYAPAGTGASTILPIAKQFGVEDAVVEITDRISFYHTLLTLKQADALFIPGSDNPQYTASKIYPYLLTYKPLLAIFNSNSSAIAVLNEFGVTNNYPYDTTEDLPGKINSFITQVANGEIKSPVYSKVAEEKYSAKNMTERQCALFNSVLNKTTPGRE